VSNYFARPDDIRNTYGDQRRDARELRAAALTPDKIHYQE